MKKKIIKKNLIKKCLYQFFNKCVISSLSFENQDEILNYFCLFSIDHNVAQDSLATLVYPKKDELLEMAFSQKKKLAILLYKEEKNFNNIEYVKIKGHGILSSNEEKMLLTQSSKFIYQISSLLDFNIENNLENYTIINILIENLEYNLAGFLKQGKEGIIFNKKLT